MKVSQEPNHLVRFPRIFPAFGSALAVVLLSALCFAQQETYNILFSFGKVEGDFPNALIRDNLGNLYGTTQYGAFYGWGNVFKLDPTGNEKVLYEFSGLTDGANPGAGVVMDVAGNLYGTTYQGGEITGCQEVASGCGVVFKVDASGRENVLYTFTGKLDGGNPLGALAMDGQGNLYGTTVYGGEFNSGTVFKIDAAGTETVLYNFSGQTDGGNPQGALLLDSNGNLYGITQHGGAYQKGTVFEFSATGQESVLHSFAGAPDGAYPLAGLTRDAAGNFYGATFQGGSPTACYSAGCGVVFKLDSSNNETVLNIFTGAADGANPEGSVALDSSGNIYGTTFNSGNLSVCASAGCGVVFKLDASGTETVLHSFGSGPNDGANPSAGVVLDPLNNIYGSTEYGVAHGTSAYGSIFTIASPGFVLSATAMTPATLSPGASASSSVNVAATGGFNGSVALSCAVQPFLASGPKCSIRPGSVSAGKTATLTVSTSAPASAMLAADIDGQRGMLGVVLAGFLAGALGFGARQTTLGRLTAMLACLVISTSMIFQAGCGGGNGGSGGTSAGAYTVTVTGTSQTPGISLQTTQLTVTVQ